MNKLSTAKRAQVVAALVEGNSIRATCRMTDVAKGTVLKLLVDLGRACDSYQRDVLVDLPCKRIQCDEIWAFVYAKGRNVTPEMGQKGAGSVWTWTALDADTKLMVSWLVGGRDAGFASAFMGDVARRLRNRVQLTTDGHLAYLTAIQGAFGNEIDYAQLIKIYGSSPDEDQRRYSPAKFVASERRVIRGNPDERHVSTSYVERQNLTMRMSMRRFTRLTNAFSKKVENLEAAVALHFMHYNFCRIHQTLRVTPAMKAGIADHVWETSEVLALLAA
ncbi:MAG TPA: IS1 family transposase [Thermoanaerobaculia bacterium]|jgi:IS1 family transposase